MEWFVVVMCTMCMDENESMITAKEGCDLLLLKLHTCYFIICHLLFKISVANYYISVLQIKFASC